MPDKHQYKIASPVAGGYRFWDVTDATANENVATIRHDVPGAEKLARLIARVMEVSEFE